jgi:hypothetical protein
MTHEVLPQYFGLDEHPRKGSEQLIPLFPLKSEKAFKSLDLKTLIKSFSSSGSHNESNTEYFVLAQYPDTITATGNPCSLMFYK